MWLSSSASAMPTFRTSPRKARKTTRRRSANRSAAPEYFWTSGTPGHKGCLTSRPHIRDFALVSQQRGDGLLSEQPRSGLARRGSTLRLRRRLVNPEDSDGLQLPGHSAQRTGELFGDLVVAVAI